MTSSNRSCPRTGTRSVNRARHPKRRHAFTKDMAKRLADKGWLTLAWPEEYGGQGRSIMEQVVYREEMSYWNVPGTDLGTGAISWVGPVLMIVGTEEQKREHLPPIAAGDRYWCTLYSEPGSGSDLASLQTAAVRDGDDYVINGQKIWTSSAHIADWGWLAARTNSDAPKHRGISLFMLDMKSPGVSVRPIVNMAGGHDFNEVYFDDVRVPAANLVGQEDRGWYTLAVALDFERSGVGYSATARRTLETLTEYARETEHNGAPLGKDPHGQGASWRSATLKPTYRAGCPTRSPGCRARGWCRTPRRPCPRCTAPS